jgi:parallel beta-helix repeat protein
MKTSRRAALAAFIGSTSSAALALPSAQAEADAKASSAFNVRDFGAVGNGRVNDTAALQKAINVAQNLGGTVLLPPGVYVITSPLRISYPVTILGAGWGSIIRSAAADRRFIPILVAGKKGDYVHGVVIRDLKLEGSRLGQLDAGAVQFNNAVGFLCDHLWITQFGEPGESPFKGVNGIGVSAGYYGGPASQGVISNCLVEETTKAGINWTTEAENGLIVGNIVRRCTGNGQTPGIQVNGGYNGKIIGNSVYQCQGPGIFVATSGYKGSYRSSRNTIIANNHVYENGISAPRADNILVDNSADLDSQFGRLIISGNVVYRSGSGGQGIKVRGESNALISNNYVYENSRTGIQIVGATNILVSDNVVEGNNTERVKNCAAIYIKTAKGTVTSSITLAGNMCPCNEGQQLPFYFDDQDERGARSLEISNISSGGREPTSLLWDYPPPVDSRISCATRTRVQGGSAVVLQFPLGKGRAVSLEARSWAVCSILEAHRSLHLQGLVSRHGTELQIESVESGLRTADPLFKQALIRDGDKVALVLSGPKEPTEWVTEISLWVSP